MSRMRDDDERRLRREMWDAAPWEMRRPHGPAGWREVAAGRAAGPNPAGDFGGFYASESLARPAVPAPFAGGGLAPQAGVPPALGEPDYDDERFLGRPSWQRAWDRDVFARRTANARPPKNYRRSDDRIRDDICERIVRDSAVDAGDVEVAVEEGVVTLSGTVPERSQKWELEDVCERALGVTEVKNRLKVRRA